MTISAALPHDEALRLEALYRYDILDTDPEIRFDRITGLASDICGAPIALVSLVDRERQWFKSRHGLEATETPRELAFCAHAILDDDIFLVPDATTDPRFSDSPLVQGEPGIRTYAGAPLKTGDGYRIGTLCVIYPEVTEISEVCQRQLQRLAAIVVDELELRLSLKNIRELERARSESEKRFQDIAETAADWIWETDEKHIFTFASDNRSFSVIPAPEYIGRSRSEVLGFDPDDARIRAHLDDLDAHRPFRDFYIEILDRQGKRQCRRASGNPVFAEDGSFKGYRGVTSDVTKQILALEALTDAKEQAELAVRTQSEFLANISHELRTPLNAVIGFAELMLKQEHGPLGTKHYVEYVTNIRDSGANLLQIINDILELSKLESGKMSLTLGPLDIAEIPRQVLSLFSMSAREKGVELTLSLSPEVPECIVGDPGRLRQILVNLVGNALKFTADGSVEVSLSYAGTPAEGMLRCDVKDTGIGISDDALDTVFGRFVQADSSTTRSFGGTGLGLTITRDLVALMDGDIGVDSVLGRGTTFWFTIPTREADRGTQDGDAARQKNVAEPTLRSLAILVAEDNVLNQKILAAHLHRLGHRVCIAGNGAEAVDMVQNQTFDIILMDINMPVMDGVSATREIRSLPGPAASIPIIAVTANAMVKDRDYYLAAGMNEYVSKPVDGMALLDAIGRCVNGVPRIL